MARAKKKLAPTISRKSAAAKITDGKHIGEEIVDWSNIEDVRLATYYAFRYYNYFYDYKDANKWVLEYVKKNYSKDEYKKYKKVAPMRTSITMGAIVRMLAYNAPLDKNYKTFLKNKIQENLRTVQDNQDEKPKVDIPVKTPADILKEKTSDFIGEIEEVIDKAWSKETFPEVENYSVYDEMTSQDFAYNVAKGVHDYYVPLRNELRELKDKKTPDLVEAYEHVPVRHRNKVLKFIENLVQESKQYMHNKKAVRKPRAKKKPSIEKQVAGLKYMESFNNKDQNVNLQSIDPLSIIGSQELILYNTKYKRVIVLVSSSREGFSVKGTTIQGIDEDASFAKTVRKPDELFAQLVKTTKARSKKLIKGLKTKEGSVTGRVNADVILYKAFK